MEFARHPGQTQNPARVGLIPRIEVGGEGVELILFDGADTLPVGVGFQSVHYFGRGFEVGDDENLVGVPGGNLLQRDLSPAFGGVGICPDGFAASHFYHLGLNPVHRRDVEGDIAVFLGVVQHQDARLGCIFDGGGDFIHFGLVESGNFGGAGFIAKDFAEDGEVAGVLFGGFKVNVDDGDAEGFDGRADAFGKVTLEEYRIGLDGGNCFCARIPVEDLFGGVIRVNQLDEVDSTLTGVSQSDDFLRGAGEKVGGIGEHKDGFAGDDDALGRGKQSDGSIEGVHDGDTLTLSLSQRERGGIWHFGCGNDRGVAGFRHAL